MSAVQNRRAIFAARPVGVAKDSDFTLETVPAEAPEDGEVLVEVAYLSMDPAMRGWMNAQRSYIAPVEIGTVMRALGAGRVIESRHPDFKPGDEVIGTFGVQTHARIAGSGLTKVDTSRVALPAHIGVLGMPGLTAYFGLLDVGALKDGETVVISGAAGAVGSVAGQIAKLKGCRVVGIAGGAEKCAYVVDDLGFDACIDYKSEDVLQQLRTLCPKRIDVFFDNVGGDILDAALACLAFKGRIILCGAISQYNNTTAVKGPANYLSLLANRARMEGFIVFDYLARYPEGVAALTQWVADGRLKHREDIVAGGVDAFVPTLNRLFSGENLGKLVLQVA
jgi:NADPH-dependent curcumin reductase CurA